MKTVPARTSLFVAEVRNSKEASRQEDLHERLVAFIWNNECRRKLHLRPA